MAAVILIVDDDLALTEMLKFVLEREGFETRSAFSGEQALQTLRNEPVDLVVLDVMLPDIDGFEISQRIRRTPAAAGVPILMLSARTQVADKLTGFDSGVDDYLAKPADPKEIVARIKALLARAHRTAGHLGRILALVGAKGGVGNTTTALNVALALASKRRVVFLDLGPGRSAGWILDLAPSQNLQGLTSGNGLRLSESTLRSCITSHPSGLDYLAGAERIDPVVFEPGTIADTLALLQQEYEVVIVDISPADSRSCEEVATHATVIAPVSEHDALSTQRLTTFSNWLQTARLATKTPGFVLVDRFSGVSKASPSAISSEVGLGVLAVIPPAPGALYHAHSRQEALLSADPEHPTSLAYKELADQLSTDPVEVAPPLRP